MKKLAVFSVTVIVLLLFAGVPVWAQDADGDFWLDPTDNCPSNKNGNQRDSDADGFGNLCDNCPFDYNPLQTDGDGDDIGDACDPPPAPVGAISGTDLEAYHACIVSALAMPANLLPAKATTAVFDTGANVIVLGETNASLIDGQGTPAFFTPGTTLSNFALDSRNMGLQTGNAQGFPTLQPEAEARNAWVRVDTISVTRPLLVGAPFANQVYAYIDHTQDTTIGPETCPAVSFWFDSVGTPVPPQDSALDPPPDPLFCADLERFGSFSAGSSTTPTKGLRYYIRGMRFKNGSNTVASPASGTISTPSRFLYDTGNKTTQISESMAGPGGLGIDTSVCTGPDCMLHQIDQVNRHCYKIDNVEIDADDGSYQYALTDPWVCVVPDGSTALGSSSDANVGMNYFETTQQLFDGINDKLCLFAGVATSNGATTINDLLDLSSVNTAFDPTPAPNAPAGMFTITATFTNISASDVTDLSFEVDAITGGNLVLNADGAPGGVGAIASVPPGDLGNGILEQGESFSIDFEIGLTSVQPFSFFVDAHGTTAP